MSQAVVDDLLALLDLEPIEQNLFRGQSPDDDRQRVFGGQVAGQALVAASRTVDDAFVHSLHAYFLRPGDPSVPIVYQVERIRDGRSFTTRRVVAVQHGQAIFHLSASFHAGTDRGPEHEVDPPPDLPSPDTLPDFHTRNRDRAAEMGEWYTRPRPIDTRVVPTEAGSTERSIWMRADGELPRDFVVHQCVCTYASDMTLLDSVMAPHGIQGSDGTHMLASLDHAMWFHRPFRADRWFLYTQDSPTANDGRGLARGLIHQDGHLVVSVVQEGLVREITR